MSPRAEIAISSAIVARLIAIGPALLVANSDDAPVIVPVIAMRVARRLTLPPASIDPPLIPSAPATLPVAVSDTDAPGVDVVEGDRLAVDLHKAARGRIAQIDRAGRGDEDVAAGDDRVEPGAETGAAGGEIIDRFGMFDRCRARRGDDDIVGVELVDADAAERRGERHIATCGQQAARRAADAGCGCGEAAGRGDRRCGSFADIMPDIDLVGR